MMGIIVWYASLDNPALEQVEMELKDVEDQIMSKQMPIQQIQKLRKKIIILGEITVILSVTILFFAALLDAGV